MAVGVTLILIILLKLFNIYFLRYSKSTMLLTLLGSSEPSPQIVNNLPSSTHHPSSGLCSSKCKDVYNATCYQQHLGEMTRPMVPPNS